MSEKYLEWMFLKTMLGHFVEDDEWEPSIFASYSFHEVDYSLKDMYDRYVELTKQLLEEYEL